MRIDLGQLREYPNHARAKAALAVLIVLVLGGLGWRYFPQIHRKPPNIFDTPVDDVLSYLAREDFAHLSVEERMAFLQGVMKRFAQMSQSESAVASAFFAGLTGPTSERMMNNARVLGKDILVQGAGEFLTKKTQAEREAFLDQWLLKWVRFGEESTGQRSQKSDEQLLAEMSGEVKRDARRGIEIKPEMAQRIVDFWERDVASVTSPKEQAQIFQFLPAIRDHMIKRNK
jgi:hypothetical protein